MVEDEVRKDTEMEKKKLERPVEKVEATTSKSNGENISNLQNEGRKGQISEASKPEPVTDTNKGRRGDKTASGSEAKEEKKEDKKPAEPVVKGKFKEAVVNGKDLRISTKHATAVCDFIRGKDVDKAIAELEEVRDMRRAIPMKGEIPHRKGMMSGRYPVKAVGDFIKLLKSARANALYHDLELEKLKLFCKANVAARPRKRFGQARFKRTHVQIKLVPRGKVKKKSKDGNREGKKDKK